MRTSDPPPPSEAARAQQAPLPPEVLADALQDRVHEELPGVRAAKSVKPTREPVAPVLDFELPSCLECGCRFEMRTGPGRTRELSRGDPLPIPDDYPSPTCPQCGDELFIREITDPLDAYLERRHNIGCADALMAVFGMRRVEE
jgi:hypothetical protein